MAAHDRTRLTGPLRLLFYRNVYQALDLQFCVQYMRYAVPFAVIWDANNNRREVADLRKSHTHSARTLHSPIETKDAAPLERGRETIAIRLPEPSRGRRSRRSRP